MSSGSGNELKYQCLIFKVDNWISVLFIILPTPTTEAFLPSQSFTTSSIYFLQRNYRWVPPKRPFGAQETVLPEGSSHCLVRSAQPHLTFSSPLSRCIIAPEVLSQTRKNTGSVTKVSQLQMTCSLTHSSLNKWDFICILRQNTQAWQSRAWAVALGGSHEAMLSLCLLILPSFGHQLLLSVSLTNWRRKWQPPSVFVPGKSHGQRSLMGYSPWGRKESDMPELTNKTPPEHLWSLYFSATGLHCVRRKGGKGRAADLPWAPFHQCFLPSLACVCLRVHVCAYGG